MPPEKKPTIEELLKASAETRRAQFGPDPAMPNPMRAYLHEEIARRDRREETPRRASWLVRFWPQLSAVTAALVLLAAGTFAWMKNNSGAGRGDLNLAMKESPNESTAADSLLKDLPAAAPMIAKQEGKESAPQADAAIASGASQAGESMPDGALAQTSRAMEKNAMANRSAQFSQNARGQTLRNQANNKQTAGVLDNFRVEKDGGEIRLIDADGSTYAGRIARAPAPAAAAQARAVKKKAAEQSGIFFRASGFNARLQKRVVFEGNYIPLSPNESKEADARVVGTAQVTGEAPVAVDAVSITR